jgi:hypothetical protein
MLIQADLSCPACQNGGRRRFSLSKHVLRHQSAECHAVRITARLPVPMIDDRRDYRHAYTGAIFANP